MIDLFFQEVLFWKEDLMKKLFTCESVCEGHPDKVCDQISDAFVDAILKEDENARIAIESVASYDTLYLTGEVHAKCSIDYEKIARAKIKEIGYDDERWGFEYDKIKVIQKIHEQSGDIRQGVEKEDEMGAGDQGMMFGYATNESENYMPLAYDLATKLAMKLADVRKNTLDYLGPDGKSQVTVEYDENDQIKRIEAIVLSNQHDEKIALDDLRNDLKKYVIDEVIPSDLIDEDTKIYINPTGKFVIGGPVGDSGLTGRKIIVDTYGGYCMHGGGAFSGKDPSKVDRSAAYYLRYIAKNLVAAGLCDKVMLQAAYVIGVSHPVSIFVDTEGSEHVALDKIYEVIEHSFDLSVKHIIEELHLTKQSYQYLASYGHFGRNDIAPAYERLDKVEAIKEYINR